MRLVTPLVLQSHNSECGAACLGSILAYFGRWVTLAELRDRCEVSRDGSSAAGIKRAAQYYGLKCVGRSVELHQFADLTLPLVVFWEFNHFLIVEGVDKDKGLYYLNDPSAGRRTLSEQEFSEGFSGIILQLSPDEDFKQVGVKPSLAKQIPRWLEGTSEAITKIILCGLLLTAVSLIVPAIVVIFVDQVLIGDERWAGPLLAVLAGSAVLSYLLTLLKIRWLQRLVNRISIIKSDRCVTQLLRMPIEYFSHRYVGDVASRIPAIDRIVQGITQQFIELLIEITGSVFILAAIAVYSPTIALVVAGLAIINIYLTYLFSRVRLDKSLTWRREQGLLLGVGTLMLHQSETLRMTASEDRLFARWSGRQAQELAARQGLAQVGHISESLPEFFMLLGNAAVLTIGAIQVMADDLTVGTLIGLYILASMFLSPIRHLVDFANQRQAIEADMQRVEDIMDASQEAGFEQLASQTESVTTFNSRLKLSGNVELRDITFGYNRARPPLIKNFSLTIESGHRVAVVGSNGSGKSTLAKIMSGLYEPWSGEVLFDGHSRNEIPQEVLTRSLSVVDQHISLFSANVRDNITLWNPSIPEETIIAAARDAHIHEQILNRTMGYETEIVQDGSNFSGGEKQRLEIARALAVEPVILILDEATSALDAASEQHIDDALRRRGMSCLIIAHRLSTIRDCDQIIVLDKGVEVQRGTHDELYEDKQGLYYKLVESN